MIPGCAGDDPDEMKEQPVSGKLIYHDLYSAKAAQAEHHVKSIRTGQGDCDREKCRNGHCRAGGLLPDVRDGSAGKFY